MPTLADQPCALDVNEVSRRAGMTELSEPTAHGSRPVEEPLGQQQTGQDVGPGWPGRSRQDLLEALHGDRAPTGQQRRGVDGVGSDGRWQGEVHRHRRVAVLDRVGLDRLDRNGALAPTDVANRYTEGLAIGLGNFWTPGAAGQIDEVDQAHARAGAGCTTG